MRAGLAGVVQQVMIEEGAQVQPGANIARVARPDELHGRAARAGDAGHATSSIGQLVAVDTRNGIVAGKVIRIDPAVVEGTVQVDVELTGKLPRGARPDQSVDGTIEIERLAGRRQHGPAARTASRTRRSRCSSSSTKASTPFACPSRSACTSVNEVEIVQGLVPGDEVILSDTSAWDDNDRIRLN